MNNFQIVSWIISLLFLCLYNRVSQNMHCIKLKQCVQLPVEMHLTLIYLKIFQSHITLLMNIKLTNWLHFEHFTCGINVCDRYQSHIYIVSLLYIILISYLRHMHYRVRATIMYTYPLCTMVLAHRHRYFLPYRTKKIKDKNTYFPHSHQHYLNRIYDLHSRKSELYIREYYTRLKAGRLAYYRYNLIMRYGKSKYSNSDINCITCQLSFHFNCISSRDTGVKLILG